MKLTPNEVVTAFEQGKGISETLLLARELLASAGIKLHKAGKQSDAVGRACTSQMYNILTILRGLDRVIASRENAPSLSNFLSDDVRLFGESDLSGTGPWSNYFDDERTKVRDRKDEHA